MDGGKTFEALKTASAMSGVDGAAVTADGAGNVIAFWHVMAGPLGWSLFLWQVGPMSTTGTATVKWASYSVYGTPTGQRGTAGVSTSGTKATAFARLAPRPSKLLLNVCDLLNTRQDLAVDHGELESLFVGDAGAQGLAFRVSHSLAVPAVFRRQFADKGPGDFGHLAVVVMHKEAKTAFIV